MRGWGSFVALSAVGLALIAPARPAWGQLPTPPELRQQFQDTDRSGDGKIDREEFHRRTVEVFYFLDKDRKGYLVITDVKGLSEESFRSANRRADGKLSLPEFLNVRFRAFALADTNGDGTLSYEEIEAYVDTLR